MYSKLAEQVSKHPIVAYVVLAFSISWATWFLSPLVVGGDRVLFAVVDAIGAFGPAISGLVISGIIYPQKVQGAPKRRAAIFLIIFGCVSALFLAGYHEFTVPAIVLTLVMAFFPAYIISSIYHPRQGIAQLVGGLKQGPRIRSWFWVAVFLPYSFVLCGLGIALGLGFALQSTFSWSGIALSSLVAYPATFFAGGPVCEEPGWRGFLLPNLQKNKNPLVSGIVVGIIWSCWHFPLYMTPFYGGGLGGFLFRFVYNIPYGILFTWLYNRSGGNLLLCMLLHCSINTSSIFGALPTLIGIGVMIAFVIVIVCTDKMWKDTTKYLPAGYQQPIQKRQVGPSLEEMKN
jgi:membrane protease YdiL (CAAX protease family)